MSDRDPRYDGLPTDWPDAACETYAQVAEAHPELDPSALAVLYQAAALEAAADRAEARVRDDGPMVPGSTGQLVAHPLIAEARQARVAAIQALRALGIASGQSSSSAAGAAMAAKRWHGSRGRAAR